MIPRCPSCGESQWSLMDRSYLALFGTCWSEDKARWEAGELKLEEFEYREKIALDNVSTHAAL